MIFKDKSQTYNIYLGKDIYKQMIGYCSEANPYETGGVLIGNYSHNQMIADILQIPAFLCRQTDLLIAAAETGKAVNIKKGQFLAPWDMKNIVVKMEESGNKNIMLCERGSTFGYNNMVVDMRSLLEMRKFNYPVVFDVTHSVQKPGGLGTATSGDREYVYPLLRAGLAVGVDAIFAEVHPNPEEAKSDGPNMLYLKDLEEILKTAIEIDKIVKGV